MKKALALILTLLLVFSLAACGSGTSDTDEPENGQETPETGGDKDTLTVRTGSMVSYDPYESNTADQFIFLDAVYATLVRIKYDENNEPQIIGNIAESWDQEEDGKVWVFHLKDGITFSNGDPITAEDVKFSVEQSMASPYHATYTGMIESVEVRDEQTVAINVANYDNSLPWLWCYTYIVQQSGYEADKAAYVLNPAASGPYTIESLDETTGNMTLKAREDYWGDIPAISTVNIRQISDADTAAISLEAGEVDIMTVYGSQATMLEENGKVAVTEQPNNSMGGLFFNCQVAPWDNVKVRQAVAYAVDYEAMSNLLYDGRVVSDSTIPFNSTVDSLPEGIPEYSTDIEKAKQLMEEAGITTPIDGGSVIGGDGGVGELLQQYLGAIGINITIQELSGTDYVNALLTSNFSLAVIPGASASFRGSTLIANCYTSTGGANYEKYYNDELDAISAELSRISDEAEYQEKLKEAVSIIAEEAPIVSFGCLQNYYAHDKSLHVPTNVNAELYIPDCYWE